MDVNVVRIIVTIVSIVAFAGIVWWVYKPSRKMMLKEEGKRILEEHE